MPHRVIPIVPIHTAQRAGHSPQLSGPAVQLQQLQAALAADLSLAMGRVPEHWLAELRLDAGEAHLGIAFGQGPVGRAVAAVAFDTLRRCLPDTDIYIGLAPD
jgi:hypothetical protein